MFRFIPISVISPTLVTIFVCLNFQDVLNKSFFFGDSISSVAPPYVPSTPSVYRNQPELAQNF